MEEVLLIVLTIVLLLLVFFLKYKENKKRKYVKKCPSCKSKNIIHKEPVFIKTEKVYIPERKDLRILSGNPRLDAMDTKYYTVEEKIFDVEYKCLDCQHIFHQELIR